MFYRKLICRSLLTIAYGLQGSLGRSVLVGRNKHMRDYTGKSARVLDMSTEDVKVVEHEDGTIVLGALSMKGLHKLTAETEQGRYKDCLIYRLPDQSVYMVVYETGCPT